MGMIIPSGAHLDARGQRHSELGHGKHPGALLPGAADAAVWPLSRPEASMCRQGSGVVWMEGRQGLSKQSYLQLEQSVELVATLVQEIRLF